MPSKSSRVCFRFLEPATQLTDAAQTQTQTKTHSHTNTQTNSHEHTHTHTLTPDALLPMLSRIKRWKSRKGKRTATGNDGGSGKPRSRASSHGSRRTARKTGDADTFHVDHDGNFDNAVEHGDDTGGAATQQKQTVRRDLSKATPHAHKHAPLLMPCSCVPTHTRTHTHTHTHTHTLSLTLCLARSGYYVSWKASFKVPTPEL